MTYKETNGREGKLYYTNEKENEDSNHPNITKIFGKSCFHIAHEKAICEALTNQENQDNAS